MSLKLTTNEGRQVLDEVLRAADEYGLSKDLIPAYLAIIGSESGFSIHPNGAQNQNAQGPLQMQREAWNEGVEQLSSSQKKRFNITGDLNERYDAYKAAMVFFAYMQPKINYAERAYGREIAHDPTFVWSYHAFGGGGPENGSSKFINAFKQDPNTPATTAILPPELFRGHPFINGQTMQGIYNEMQKRLNSNLPVGYNLDGGSSGGNRTLYAQFHQNWEGIDYVWGGKECASGLDCQGFASQVAKFEGLKSGGNYAYEFARKTAEANDLPFNEYVRDSVSGKLAVPMSDQIPLHAFISTEKFTGAGNFPGHVFVCAVNQMGERVVLEAPGRGKKVREISFDQFMIRISSSNVKAIGITDFSAVEARRLSLPYDVSNDRNTMLASRGNYHRAAPPPNAFFIHSAVKDENAGRFARMLSDAKGSRKITEFAGLHLAAPETNHNALLKAKAPQAVITAHRGAETRNFLVTTDAAGTQKIIELGATGKENKASTASLKATLHTLNDKQQPYSVAYRDISGFVAKCSRVNSDNMHNVVNNTVKAIAHDASVHKKELAMKNRQMQVVKAAMLLLNSSKTVKVVLDNSSGTPQLYVYKLDTHKGKQAKGEVKMIVQFSDVNTANSNGYRLKLPLPDQNKDIAAQLERIVCEVGTHVAGFQGMAVHTKFKPGIGVKAVAKADKLGKPAQNYIHSLAAIAHKLPKFAKRPDAMIHPQTAFLGQNAFAKQPLTAGRATLLPTAPALTPSFVAAARNNPSPQFKLPTKI